MKFIDYESSHITPQMTLLKKFNELLKFLRGSNVSTFYKHEVLFMNSSHQALATITFISPKESFSELSEIIEDVKYFGYTIIPLLYDSSITSYSISRIFEGGGENQGKYYIGKFTGSTEVKTEIVYFQDKIMGEI